VDAVDDAAGGALLAPGAPDEGVDGRDGAADWAMTTRLAVTRSSERRVSKGIPVRPARRV
jgi:hypothetical protein